MEYILKFTFIGDFSVSIVIQSNNNIKHMAELVRIIFILEGATITGIGNTC